MSGFVAWRFRRMVKAHAIRGDRQYDRRDKFDLPTEYSDSESATAARRRNRRKYSADA